MWLLCSYFTENGQKCQIKRKDELGIKNIGKRKIRTIIDWICFEKVENTKNSMANTLHKVEKKKRIYEIIN